MTNKVPSSSPASKRAPLVRVHDLSVVYTRRSGLGARKVRITALDRVNLEVAAGSTLAVVGESGGGKSTLARCMALLEEPTSGEVFIDGQPMSGLSGKEKKALRPGLQLIFQDPASAVNPRFRTVDAVAEPLAIRGWGDRSRRRDKALELMDVVGLDPGLAERRSLELSGGQRQRLVIARALAADPQLLILDEALSGLDLSLQSQIVNLLLRLQERYALTYVFISHDLRMAAHLADRVVVIDRGRIKA